MRDMTQYAAVLMATMASVIAGIDSAGAKSVCAPMHQHAHDENMHKIYAKRGFGHVRDKASRFFQPIARAKPEDEKPHGEHAHGRTHPAKAVHKQLAARIRYKQRRQEYRHKAAERQPRAQSRRRPLRAQIMPQHRVSYGGVAHVHRPLLREAAHEVKRPIRLERGIKYAGQKPYEQKIPHELFRRGIGKRPRYWQKRVHQQHYVDVIQVKFVPEQHNILERLNDALHAHFARHKQAPQPVKRRPDEHGDDKPQHIAQIQLFYRKLLFRAQHQRTAAHEKQRDCRAAKTAPHDGQSVLRRADHARVRRKARRNVDHDNARHGKGFYKIDPDQSVIIFHVPKTPW